MFVARPVWYAAALAAAVALHGYSAAIPAARQAFAWQAATPESQGMSKPALDARRDRLAATTKALLVVRNGAMGWWSNASGKYADLPRDAFWGSGAGHQVVFVVPSLKLIAVRNGASLGEAMEHHDTLRAVLFGPLVAAIPAKPAAADSAAPPYPRSPVIAGVSWAPLSSVRRAARGSDTWPLTWGADDALYSSFGAPTFLNFGPNYAGARDGFVYVYSHDFDSAYTPADRMVLARVPRTRIRERDAYEFFHGVGQRNQPLWTADIEARVAVFTHAGRCYRSGISYNAGLRRYLWSQTLPGTDARFEGGFGVYDAPEPWGPWTTAFFTERWDTGPGESSPFPPKWMSADGRVLHLVFSGDDAFSVRRADLVLTDGGRGGRVGRP